jgi:hypothetical protein
VRSQLQEKNQTFIMLGMHLSYLIRSSDPTNSFIRIELYGQPTVVPPRYREKLSNDQLFILTNDDPDLQPNVESHDRILRTQHVSIIRSGCNEYSSISERYWICPAVKK